MQLRKWSVVLLTLLLAAMAMVPMVSAKTIDVNTIHTPSLHVDTTQKNTNITGAFSTLAGNDVYTVPEGSIIHHSANGITYVFDSTGKQILVASDAASTKIATPEGLEPASVVHAVPQGALLLTPPGKKNTTYVVNENGDLVMTVIDDASSGRVSPMATPLLSSNWLAWADATVSQISYLQSTWYTPTAPSSKGYALAIFNGLETANTILQPVLQWNYNLNNSDWTIASWRYTSSTSYYYSPMLSVTQGDNIQGTLQYTTVNGQTGWQVTTSDLTKGTSTYYFSNYISTNTNLEIVNTLEQAQGSNSNPYNLCGYIVFHNVNIPAVTLSSGTISYPSDWAGLFSVYFSPNPTMVTIYTP
ncbi:hypothetical protein [Methanoregula sp.]|uniref:hypothetical protein n=1 Tax=Methanoregula sp. TaxID=2052170 RepID=UPI003C22143F